MSPPVLDVPSPSTNVLVVGSLATAGDGSYQSVINSIQGAEVERQLVDRILDNAASLSPGRYHAIHVVLGSSEYAVLGASLPTLLSTIHLALQTDGTLHVLNLAPGVYDLATAGFTVVSTPNATELIAKKAAPSAAKSVPLPRRANGAAKKKQMLWALSEPAPGTPPIDADALLTESDRARPAPCEPFQEGAPRRKKACKNCSCGLAEIEAEEERLAVKVVLDSAADALSGAGKTSKVTSSCGSCYLGDAFRCASCPYLGLPAFEPGQKIELVGMGDDL
jgi:hypothetical protein